MDLKLANLLIIVYTKNNDRRKYYDDINKLFKFLNMKMLNK